MVASYVSSKGLIPCPVGPFDDMAKWLDGLPAAEQDKKVKSLSELAAGMTYADHRRAQAVAELIRQSPTATKRLRRVLADAGLDLATWSPDKWNETDATQLCQKLQEQIRASELKAVLQDAINDLATKPAPTTYQVPATDANGQPKTATVDLSNTDYCQYKLDPTTKVGLDDDFGLTPK